MVLKMNVPNSSEEIFRKKTAGMNENFMIFTL
jgi:hypothetical protein